MPPPPIAFGSPPDSHCAVRFAQRFSAGFTREVQIFEYRSLTRPLGAGASSVDVPPPDIVGVPGISAVLLPRLVNELAGQGDITLVLDDFHLLSTGVARDSLAWLIQYAPPTLHIVVASRTEPALPLSAVAVTVNPPRMPLTVVALP